jgi:hypothetical protein
VPKIVQACVNLKPVGKVHQRVTEINSVEKSAEFIFFYLHSIPRLPHSIPRPSNAKWPYATNRKAT